jgi:hypothetical protein
VWDTDARRRQIVDEVHPDMAPLLLSYGKCLYELAYSQQGVMGKEEVNKETEEAGGSILRLLPMELYLAGFTYQPADSGAWLIR